MLDQFKQTLNTQLQPLKVYWAGLAPREQMLLKALAVVLGVLLLYWLLWSPIESAQQQAQQKLESARKEWLWLNEQQSKLAAQPNRIQPARVDSQARLTSYLQQQLRQQNLSKYLSQMVTVKTGRNDGVEVVFDEVPAPRFFRWLSKMEKEGVYSTKASMQPIKKGVISARVQFEVKK